MLQSFPPCPPCRAGSGRHPAEPERRGHALPPVKPSARAVEHGRGGRARHRPPAGQPAAGCGELPGIRYAITSNGAAVWDLGDDPMGCCATAAMPTLPRAPHQRTRLPAAPPDADRSGPGSSDLFQQYARRAERIQRRALRIKTPRRALQSSPPAAAPAFSPPRRGRHLTDGRFTVIPAGIESWMSRHAHEVEKAVHVLRQHRERAPLPCQLHGYPGRGRGAGVRRITLK